MANKQGQKVNKQAQAARRKRYEEDAKLAKQGLLTKAEQKKQNRTRLIAALAIIFSFLLALSMMLPSLSAIFADNAGQGQVQETVDLESSQATEQSATTDATETTQATQTTINSMETLDSAYSSLVSDLETKLASDPKDLPSLINVANDYYQWGVNASSYATTDEDTTHVNELLDKAIGYYDQYLELNDANSVRLNRAMAQYYKGETDAAIKALEELGNKASDYPNVWAQLGSLYENQGKTDEAKQAYTKAAAADSDGSANIKAYAESRIQSLVDSENETSEASDASTQSVQDLTNTLESASGTSTN
ncbi:MAG: tetratricopeptide repeat protein [Atopobiaceae bacterium]|nr:tetratricopeptide repeat protein [Atopobiaceae bacterium]